MSEDVEWISGVNHHVGYKDEMAGRRGRGPSFGGFDSRRSALHRLEEAVEMRPSSGSLLRTLAFVPLRVMVVQHGDKERLPGDPGLTELGCTQALPRGGWRAGTRQVGIWSSPMRRARETTTPIVEELAASRQPSIHDCASG
jgi:Histidine phosphatase superfamily (branch 1)